MSRIFAFPLLLSFTLHGLVLAVVLFSWGGSDERPSLQRPNIVQAEIVEFTPRSVREAEAEAEAEQQRVIDMRERQRQQEAQEAERREQEAQQQRQAREREQREQREREEQERAERERQQQAERERREREQAEQERQEREQAERRRQEQQQRLDQALADEDEFMQASQAEAAAQSYVAAIERRIADNWSRPPSARRGMQSVLEIQLVPTGRVVDVRVVESSGNAAFDRSAEQAVRRVDQFDVVRDMSSEVFERHFRRLRLVFNPEDLRQ